MSFSAVEDFEKELARWWGAPYAVAVDCCTHAVELCLRKTRPTFAVSCPSHTYLSIPMTFSKLDLDWKFSTEQWRDYYYIGGTNIIDGAVYWKQNGYIPNTLLCLSFQFKKPLNLGRGGAILCEYYDDYVELKKMAYDGRFGDTPWAEQDVDTLGYHYYMTPETALQGMEKLPEAHLRHTKQWSYQDYPDLSKMKIFND